ncbi:MAG: TspO/MBR family protein [Tissierellia bacterium]|nr:TspO/MBR family protein [Tissierellia bacterium]
MTKMTKTKKIYITAILLTLTLITNALGAFGFINGMSQQDVSNKYPTLITPAGFTFSIWSVIYLLLIISIIILYLKRDDDYYKIAIDKISIYFWISCILNMFWIFAFSYENIGLSTVFIALFLISLIAILRKLYEIRQNNKILLPITFAIYSGWVYIATFVNIAVFLESINFNKFGLNEEIYYIVFLCISIFIAGLLENFHKNAVFNLPIAWAFFGIARSESVMKYKLLNPILFAGIVFLIAVSGILFYKNGYKIMPSKKTIDFKAKKS